MSFGSIGALQQTHANYNKTGSAAMGGSTAAAMLFGDMLNNASRVNLGGIQQMSPYLSGTGLPWSRTAGVADSDMVQYVTQRKNPTMAEFTAAYEKNLAAKGLPAIDYAALVKDAKSFSDVFSDYQLLTKVGNCHVTARNWQRNDFPFWEFFKEDTPADALNDWRPTGPEPSQLDPAIQKNMHSIGSGKMSILIPEKLQKKMDADPAYATEVYAKVAKWKTDYDRWDNATAASLGMDVAEEQMSKSYCIQLDENGNVANATITSPGGFSGPTEEEMRQFKAEQAAKRKRKIQYHRMVEESAWKHAQMQQELLAEQVKQKSNLAAYHA